MKRPVITAGLLCALAGLAGCPIYDHENAGCHADRDCASNYVCDRHSGDCVQAFNSSCTKPSDCDATATCTPAGSCVFGDCTFNPCFAGYRCDASSGIWSCVPNGSGAAGSSSQGGESGASAAGATGVGTAGAAEVATGGAVGG